MLNNEYALISEMRLITRKYGSIVNPTHWAKGGKGLLRGMVTFPCDDHYRR